MPGSFVRGLREDDCGNVFPLFRINYTARSLSMSHHRKGGVVSNQSTP